MPSALLAVVALAATAGTAQASLRSAVDTAVPHSFGRLLGVVPRAHTRLHAALVDTGQPPPAGNPTLCPANASSPPYAMCYYGGPVLRSNSVYTVFWQPAALPGGVSGFSGSYIPVVNGFFQNVASSPGLNDVYQTDVQYFDQTGSAGNSSKFAGTIVDHNGFPANLGLLGGCPPNLSNLTHYCLTDNQLVSELDALINANGWPRGLGPAYMIFLPPGVDVCAADTGGPSCSYDVFCAYHSAYAANNGPPVLYGVLPYAAVAGCDNGQHPNGSDADAVLDVASHEHNEIVTDPLGNGWLDVQGNEDGDKCARNYGNPLGSTSSGQYNQVIGGGHYFIQSEWSNIANGCALGLADQPPVVDFALRAAVVGQPAAFVANASDPDGTVRQVAWNFGDGATATGASATHTFSSLGTYTVTVSAVDNAGLATIASHTVTVGTGAHTSSASALAKFGLSPHQSVRTVLRSGLRITIRCRKRCSVSLGLLLAGSALGHASKSLSRAGSTHVVVKLSAGARRSLHAGHAITITIQARSGGVTSSKSVRLR
jgi:hypothetical protein